MSIYEKNMDAIQEHYPEIWEKIKDYHRQEQPQILVGEAEDGDTYLALVRGNEIHPLNSIYSPIHAVRRYIEQLKELPESTVLLLFGFGDGRVIREILSDRCPITMCIVYEPVLDIFMQALHEYDLTDILIPEKLQLILYGVNQLFAENIIHENVSYLHWKTFSIASLPVYSNLYNEELQICFKWYQKGLESKQVDMNTGLFFSESKFSNEIRALKWLVNSYSMERMKEIFPKEIPCIVVAAGPSLEKNVEELKRAKGRACIIAVDSATKFLIDHDIYPDFTCTLDPNKPVENYDDERMQGMPVFLCPSSNARLLEKLKSFDPIYVSHEVEYYLKMAEKQGVHMINIPHGGSVATVAFSVAVKLGFRTIIIIGQDLAYTNQGSHAGTGKASEEELNRYGSYEVEGYYGDTVMTSGDFMFYLNWYNQTIPRLTEDHRIINSTEGGARIQGAVQMPLREAIERYCKEEVDCHALYKGTGRIWDTREARLEYYHDLEDGLKTLQDIKVNTVKAIEYAEKSMAIIRDTAAAPEVIQENIVEMNRCIDQIRESGLYDILCVRIEDDNVNMAEGLDQKHSTIVDEQWELCSMLCNHMKVLQPVVEDAMTIWDETMKELAEEISM